MESNNYGIPLPTHLGEDLIFYAISHADTTDLVYLLEDDEVDVNVRNLNGATPLHYSVYYDNPQMVEIVLSYGADPNLQEHQHAGAATPLHRAIEKQNLQIVKMLLDAGANPNLQSKNGFNALHYACKVGSKKIAEMLLTYGVDYNQRDKLGYNPTYIAQQYHQNHMLTMEKLPAPKKITKEEFSFFCSHKRFIHGMKDPVKKKKKKKKK